MSRHKLFGVLVNLVFINFLTRDPGDLLPFAEAILLAIKIWFDAVAQFESTLVSPSMALDALLKPARPHSDGLCANCYDQFCRPQKLSCNHVFCRDCALRTLASRDTCPLCFETPVPFSPLAYADSQLNLKGCVHWMLGSSRAALWWLPFLVSWCVWHWRLPNHSDVMRLVMRACFQACLYMALFDYLTDEQIYEDEVLEQAELYAEANMWAFSCILFATSSWTAFLSWCAVLFLLRCFFR